jgi:hypothetical protein
MFLSPNQNQSILSIFLLCFFIFKVSRSCFMQQHCQSIQQLIRCCSWATCINSQIFQFLAKTKVTKELGQKEELKILIQ